MTARLVFILGIVLMVIASGFYLQYTNGFYFMEKSAWLWLISYIKDYKTLPEFLTNQFFLLGVLIPIYWIILAFYFNRNRTKILFGNVDKNNLHGSAKWGSWQDLRRAGLTGDKGVVVGGYRKGKSLKKLMHNGAEHILCFAPTGSGKGIGLVLPTLLSWEESVLVLDIKGENFLTTAGYRQSIGQKVLKFDPSEEFGSIKFNPLEEVRLGTNYETSDVQNIVDILLDSGGKSTSDPHWRNNAFGWLTAGILYTLYKIYAEEKRIASLYDVSCIMSGSDLVELLETMIVFNPVFEEEIREQVKITINNSATAVLSKHEGERSGVHSTAITPLILYADPIVAKNTSRSDFRVIDLINKEQPISLYVILPPSDMKRLIGLFRIFVDMVLKKLTKKLPEKTSNRLLLMLDEFTSIGKLDIFEETIAYMRGYGIKSFIIIQDLTQLHSKYGKEESITSNCHIRIAYAPNTIETAKVLSDMTGKTTIIQEKTSSSKGAMSLIGNVSNNVTETARPLLTPDECMTLRGAEKSNINPKKVVKGGDMLIFPAGFPVIRGEQYLYFKDKELLRRSQMKAPEFQEIELLEEKPVLNLPKPEEETQERVSEKDQASEVSNNSSEEEQQSDFLTQLTNF